MADREDRLKLLWDEANRAYELLRREQARLGTKLAKELRPLEDDFQEKHRRWWLAAGEESE